MPEQPASSDAPIIANAARDRIGKETKTDLSQWNGPKITTLAGDYKVEWYPPNDDATVEMKGYDNAVLTVYKNGEWTLYDLEDRSHEGKMMPLHDRRWVTTLKSEGVNTQIAISSCLYYRDLCLDRNK